MSSFFADGSRLWAAAFVLLQLLCCAVIHAEEATTTTTCTVTDVKDLCGGPSVTDADDCEKKVTTFFAGYDNGMCPNVDMDECKKDDTNDCTGCFQAIIAAGEDERLKCPNCITEINDYCDEESDDQNCQTENVQLYKQLFEADSCESFKATCAGSDCKQCAKELVTTGFCSTTTTTCTVTDVKLLCKGTGVTDADDCEKKVTTFFAGYDNGMCPNVDMDKCKKDDTNGCTGCVQAIIAAVEDERLKCPNCITEINDYCDKEESDDQNCQTDNVKLYKELFEADSCKSFKETCAGSDCKKCAKELVTTGFCSGASLFIPPQATQVAAGALFVLLQMR